MCSVTVHLRRVVSVKWNTGKIFFKRKRDASFTSHAFFKGVLLVVNDPFPIYERNSAIYEKILKCCFVFVSFN